MRTLHQKFSFLNNSNNIILDYQSINDQRIKTILNYNFNQDIKFNLPSGIPPLISLKYINDILTEIPHIPLKGEEISVNIMIRNLPSFITDANKSYTNKELHILQTRYIKILKELTMEDRLIISLMKDKNLQSKYENIIHLRDIILGVL